MPSNPASCALASRHRTCCPTSRPGAPGIVHPVPLPVLSASLRTRPLLSACAGSLALAALPKCPLCLLAYAGVAGSAGFASAYGAWLLPLTAAALALTVGALALAGAGAGPVALGAASSAGVLLAKFRMDERWMLYAALAALLAAAAWGALRRRTAAPACTTCAGEMASAAPPASTRTR